MVVTAAGGIPWSVRFRRLLDVGGVPGQSLPVWPLPSAVLVPSSVWRLGIWLVRSKARLVACRLAVLGRFPDPVGARWFQGYLLLLPRGLLQGILGRPACLCRRRASKAIPWRAVLS